MIGGSVPATGDETDRQDGRARNRHRGKPEIHMGGYEKVVIGGGALGQNTADNEMFVELGIMCATERLAPADLVSAHKWFNLAALRGNKKAIRLRLEIASEMSQSEIAAAQRAARDWLATH